MVENTNEQPREFSPFDAPVKDTGVKPRPQVDNNGLKIEQITDAELDGKQPGQNPFGPTNPNQPNQGGGFGFGGGAGTNLDMPKDAPEFIIPNYDEIPTGGFGNPTDPKIPGSGGGGAGGGGTNNPGAGTQNGNANIKVDDNFSKEWAEYTAKWLIDIFFTLLVMGLQRFAMIDRSEFIGAVNSGLIDKKYLRYMEEANENTKSKIFVTDDEKAMVVEPLKKMMEVKKISVKPEYMVFGSLAMVGISVGMRAMDIKKANTELLDRMIRESAEDRAANAGRGKRSSNNPNRYEDNPEEQSFTEEHASPGFTVVKGEGTNEDVLIPETEEVPNDN